MTIAKKIETFMTQSSWIRKMFEEGARLKSLHGAENVFDFSLGNPDLAPPAEFQTVLREKLKSSAPGDHGYMPNNGYPHTRAAVADYVAREQGVALTADHIVMTCGAAGALNVVLKAILDPGDEVLTPTPFFVEYRFYADNHGGVLKTVPSHPDFTLDVDALAAAVTPRTKAVLINSPNNPTGQVYSEASLKALVNRLQTLSAKFERTIYLVADEPYRKIVYDGVNVPSIMSAYDDSILVSSYSKDISIAGERLGFIAVNPQTGHRDPLLAALALANRILGFVNAPAMAQRAVAELQGRHVDVAVYARRRAVLCQGLEACGYDFVTPAGAFYLFPRSPIADDVQFVQALQEERILAVPGSGFGGPGHFRLSYCVDDAVIQGALPGFERAMASVKS